MAAQPENHASTESRANYHEIHLAIEGGSAEGYLIDAGAENLRNFLEKEVDEKLASCIATAIGSKVQTIAIVKNVEVDKDRRGEGLGNALVSKFFEEAQGAQGIILLADANEEQADGFVLQRFYEGFDFECVTDQSQSSSGPLMVHPIDLAEHVRQCIDKAAKSAKRKPRP